VRCTKGVLCQHDPDDSIWGSPCSIAEASEAAVDGWLEIQWTPRISLPEGKSWAGNTIVVHQGPMLDLRGRRSTVFTREVKPA
jgi:hypothetical protein